MSFKEVSRQAIDGLDALPLGEVTLYAVIPHYTEKLLLTSQVYKKTAASYTKVANVRSRWNVNQLVNAGWVQDPNEAVQLYVARQEREIENANERIARAHDLIVEARRLAPLPSTVAS